jgi:hypothetical protein
VVLCADAMPVATSAPKASGQKICATARPADRANAPALIAISMDGD